MMQLLFCNQYYTKIEIIRWDSQIQSIKKKKNAKFSKLPNSVNSVVILHQSGNILTLSGRK